MGQALQTLGIDHMSVDDRIALVQDIWDSVAVEAGLLPLTDVEKGLIEQRLAEDDTNPDDVVAWETIKAEAQSRWQR
ncbi:MAG: addiction module protein [Methylophilaceae bacterium]